MQISINLLVYITYTTESVPYQCGYSSSYNLIFLQCPPDGEIFIVDLEAGETGKMFVYLM